MERYAVIAVDPLTGTSITSGIYEAPTFDGGDIASEQAHAKAKLLEGRGFLAFVVGLKG